MALDALGGITIAANGTVSKSGECERLWDLLEANAVAQATELGTTLPIGPSSVRRKRAQARTVTAIVTYFYECLTIRAKARITTSDSALQKTPNPNNADTPTGPPDADKFLGIV